MKYSNIIIVLLTVTALFLTFRLWVGTGSYTQINDLKKQIEDLEEQNELKQAENKQLLAEIEEFRGGDDAVEERARSDFGMIKQGETFYQVILKPEPQSTDGGNTESDDNLSADKQ